MQGPYSEGVTPEYLQGEFAGGTSVAGRSHALIVRMVELASVVQIMAGTQLVSLQTQRHSHDTGAGMTEFELYVVL